MFKPLTAIKNLLAFIEKFLVSVRDLFWSYPDLLLSDNPKKTYFMRVYLSSAPYSHFIFSISSFLVIVVILFGPGIPRILSTSENTLIEGVVMGVDSNGEAQKLSKINPILPSNIQLEKDIVNLIYEPLLRYEFVPVGDGTYIGGVENILANEVITIKSGADYQFNLRKGVQWHDSNGIPNTKGYHEFDADDVIRTFQLIQLIDSTSSNSNNSNAYTRALKQLQWEKIDDYTVRVCTIPLDAEPTSCDDRDNNPIFSNFLELLSFKIVPAHLTSDITKENIDTSEPRLYRSPVGTGKFKLDQVADGFIQVRVNYEHYSLEDDYIMDKAYEEYGNLLTNNPDIDEFDFNSFLYKVNVEVLSKAPVNNPEAATFKIDTGNKSNTITSIKFVYFRTLKDAVDALKNAEVHSLASISVEFKDSLKQFTQIKSELSPVLYNQFWALYFNLRTTPDGGSIAPEFLLDPDVRRAISMAIDRNDIISEALKGVGAEAFGPIPNISYFFNKEAGWNTFNKDEAKKILFNAGWTIKSGDEYRTNDEGEIMEFSLYFVDNYDRREVAETIKADLADIGINVIIDKDEQIKSINAESVGSTGWSLDDLNNQILAPRLFDVILYGMNTFIDPDRYELYHSSQIDHPGLNISGYISLAETVDKREDRQEGESSVVNVPKVDKYLELARSFNPDQDREARKDRYFTVQELLAEDVPVVYLYHPQFIYFTNKLVRSIDLTGVDSLEDRFIDIGNWEL